MIENIIKEIDSYDKVLILGYGREGKSTYKFIRKYLGDKHLYIADSNEELVSKNPELDSDDNVTLILGNNCLDNLDDYDLIIKSPGINFKYVDYSSFEDKITSQIDLFLRYSNCKTIGVTGTKGKSTTSSLIYHVISNMHPNTIFAGNIGIPVFDKIEEVNEDTIFVLELSCHQLKFVKASPNISILLNLYEEHLDLYKSYEDYIYAKLNIFKYQKDGDYKIWGLDSKDSNKYFKDGNNTFTYSTNPTDKGVTIKEDGLYLNGKLAYLKDRKRKILGEHNYYNIAPVLIVSDILKLDIDKVCDLVDTFNPLEHRLEYVGKFKGIDFYNDSISTIPMSTINCINAVDNAYTVVVGGLDRGIDYSELIDFLYKNDKIGVIICLKDTGYFIADELIKRNSDKIILKALDMEDVVRLAYKYTLEGKACMLSPAAASYNTYKNFEERGKDYKTLVMKKTNKQ